MRLLLALLFTLLAVGFADFLEPNELDQMEDIDVPRERRSSLASGRWGLRPGKRSSLASGRWGLRPGKRSIVDLVLEDDIEDESDKTRERRNLASGRWGLRPGKRSLANGRWGLRPGKRSMGMMPTQARHNPIMLLIPQL
ncbi:unnamed protein product [Bursaphelenchus xylophilus]|uniref:(pine wood nematode) hypothetical protein n=1 Tax=Bursaphelenchus xylophilus TaxID=6326 RepID=A0A1I7SR65_BURXY|nr:unnamed protein product [Bursaphelenchus xylophilus]CAG9110895.1 unnamed protein product [Bursaphelenchus xylophilus]